MFKGRDGIVRYTDGDAPASRRPGGDGIEVTLRVTARGGAFTMQTENELVPTLRVRGLPATLSPHGDDPLAEAVELRVAGSRPRVMPLQQALQALNITWTPVGDTADADATQLAPPQTGDMPGVARDDTLWAVQAPGDDEAAVWERAGYLCT
eukprot:1257002-Pleurochrysis_carterae.AAC.1